MSKQTTPLCAQDYADLAKEALPADVWAWLESAGADGLSARANLSAYAKLQLLPRVLRSMAGANTRSQLLGEPLAHPLLLAPSAWHGLVHPQAEHATALAAAASATPMVLSCQSGSAIEDLCAAPDPAQIWFQLYFQAQRAASLRLAQRALDCGVKHLVLTVDAPVNGTRNSEQRSGFSLPAHIRSVHLAGLAAPSFRQVAAPGQPLFDSGLLEAAPTWQDIAWLRGALPQAKIWLKGILHPADAALAIEHGADGIIVSNHGGRCLDTVPATISALPAVAAAVNRRVPILLDGGIRRGTDILKAIALGAQAVLIGRPVLHALAVGGASALLHLIQLLRAELEVAMALCGCRTLAEVDSSIIMP